MGSKKLVLVLGGARSGKSRFALRLASQLGERVLYVAPARALDAEMRERIERHRKERPSSWRTLESPESLGTAIKQELLDAQVVLIDCITLLLSNLMGDTEGKLEQRAIEEIEELMACYQGASAHFILVSNEVGMGLVPPYPLGRAFRDLLGAVNQRLAERADIVYLMVAGIPLRLKAHGEIDSTGAMP